MTGRPDASQTALPVHREHAMSIELKATNAQTGSPADAEADALTPTQAALGQVLEEFDVQPVLFIGAGLARRYLGAPDWEGALRHALEAMASDAPAYSYFVQKYGDDMVAIGTAIGDLLFEWAWTKGKGRFDAALYEVEDRYIFLKSIVASHISDLGLPTTEAIAPDMQEEIEALRSIRPHAIITTNYDNMLEDVFKGYEPIVGKGVLRYDLNSFGEIFHIHGIAGDAASLILTEPDYRNWEQQSRYFAAKLLTYFVEHPVFIFGYGLGDPNVRSLLQDIGRITADDDGLISNVIQIVWQAEKKSYSEQSEFVIDDDSSGKQYRLRIFNVTSMKDVFGVLSARHELKQVNPAMLRALSARLMKLTRRDIPGGTVEVDYATLEKVASDDSYLPAMLGLTFADSDNKTHPFTISQVADEMKLKGWNDVDKIIKKIKLETGINLRSSDNRYHERIKTGKNEASAVRKWSHEALDLFKSVLEGKAYKVTE